MNTKTSRPVLLPLIRLLLFASVLGPAAFFGFFAWHSYTTILQSAHNRADRMAAIVQEHALKVFETIGLIVQRADQELEGVSWDDIRTSRQVWERLRRMQNSSEQVGALFVIDRDDGGALSTRVLPSPPTSFADRDYFFAQKQADRGLYVGQAYTGKISNDSIFNFSIRRSSPTGEFDGVIGASARVGYFLNFYRSIGIPSDNFSITLLREDGHVLVRYPALQSGVKIDGDGALLRRLRERERGSFVTPSPLDGTERLLGYVKLRGFPVYAIYNIDRAAVTAKWLESLWLGAGLASGAALCLWLACWFALRRARHEQQAMQSLTETTSALKREIDRRERAEASLLQTQRLEAIGQLTGGIAHDFNNLLTIISGNLELAERRSDLPSIRRLHKSIRYATDRATGLTAQLLAFARRRVLDPVTVELNVVLEKVHVFVEHSVPDTVRVELDLTPEPCTVRLDVSELEAAILNIAGNARDAIQGGGTIVIATRRMPGEPAGGGVEHGLACVELSITDNGCGMPPEVLKRVYEPFFTTKTVGKGTGLGLSQVYGFVQQSGGIVAIDSEVGRGTRVVIRFPLSAEPVAELDAESPAPRPLDRAATVLIVEDDAEVRKVSGAILQELGHQILVARNGDEALALIRAGLPIDILFADVAMPGGISGVELGKAAVAAAPSMRVLLTTGYPGHAEILSQNEFAVLPKPYARADLEAAIRVLLEPADRVALAGQ